MEPYEILALVRRFTPLLLAHLVLGAIAGYAIAAFSPPVFTSTASALVTADSGGAQSVTPSQLPAFMPTLVEVPSSSSTTCPPPPASIPMRSLTRSR